jgi:hypothetical protein
MSELKICNMGHYFQQSLADCPYCPKPSNITNSGETVLDGLNPNANSSDKTQAIVNPSYPSGDNGSISEKTSIVINKSASFVAGTPEVATRKLVAWLVTFDKNPNGKDFKLFEGRNVIGSQKGNDIIIDFDSTISAKHLTILFRTNEFLFKDELSTNGTYINGIMENSGSLKDGDIIKISETEFLFRTAFKQK